MNVRVCARYCQYELLSMRKNRAGVKKEKKEKKDGEQARERNTANTQQRKVSVCVGE